MAATAAGCKVPLILMHMKGTPKTMQVDPVYDDLIPDIEAYFPTFDDFETAFAMLDLRLFMSTSTYLVTITTCS
mgnify:CR=1 FL=1